MISVDTVNETEATVNSELYTEVIRDSLKRYHITANVEVELRFVSKATMTKLNKQYRAKDYASDVLSFPIWPTLSELKKQQGKLSLGSIVICPEIAQAEAENEDQPIEEKIVFLIKHSVKHLCGFHHKGD